MGHRLTPSASGFLVKRNQLRFYVNHNLSQRMSTRIGFRVEDTQSVGDAAPLNDRDYVRAEFSLNWQLERRWRLTGGYDYTAQQFVNQGTGSTSSNPIYIGIGYQGLSRPGAP
jgi:hypothetical protein